MINEKSNFELEPFSIFCRISRCFITIVSKQNVHLQKKKGFLWKLSQLTRYNNLTSREQEVYIIKPKFWPIKRSESKILKWNYNDNKFHKHYSAHSWFLVENHSSWKTINLGFQINESFNFVNIITRWNGKLIIDIPVIYVNKSNLALYC